MADTASVESLSHQYRKFIVRHFTFYRAHVVFILVLSLVGAAIIYAIDGHSHSYLACLFTAVSAASATGLQVITPSTFRPGSLFVIAFLMEAGGTVLVSIVPVIIRRHYFSVRAAERVPDRSARLEYLRQCVEYRALGWVIAIAFVYWFTVQVRLSV
jgi:Trk-type K+ transport system membrane component